LERPSRLSQLNGSDYQVYMEVGLGSGDFVLDGYPAPPKRGTAPSFRPMSNVAKRLDGWRCHLVRK